MILVFLTLKLLFAKLKNYKSPSFNQIPEELFQAGCETIRSEIHKLINYISNTEKLPDQWKVSIIVPVYKKGDKTDCCNYSGILLLSNSYKILSNIFLSCLSPYINKIIGDNQCGFRRNRSTTAQLEWKYCTIFSLCLVYP
jgi:hypothetical protein